MSTEVLEALPFRREILSPEQYLDLSERERENILSSRPIPAGLDPDLEFGGIEVVWRDPVYRITL